MSKQNVIVDRISVTLIAIHVLGKHIFQKTAAKQGDVYVLE